MRFCIYIIFIFLLFLFGCRKDVGKLPTSNPVITPSETFICADTALNWEKFPNPPPTGYEGYFEKPKETVFRVLYDPTDKNIIYYTTNEGKNLYTLWKYNRAFGTKIQLAVKVSLNIDINKEGWLVYDTDDFNIYKIKSNGDSLTKLTIKSRYDYPVFSEDGKKILFWDKSDPKGRVYGMDVHGNFTDTLTGIYGPVFPIKEFIYYVKLDNSIFYLIQRNLENNTEKNILIREIGNTLNENILWFYTNEDNTILYWYGDHGLSKTDLKTLQTTRLVNGGYGSQNPMLNYRRSSITGRFIAIQYNVMLKDSFTIRGYNKIIEFSEDGSCRRIVEIPD